MAETRHHIRRLPEIEARDEAFMQLRRQGVASVDAAQRLGMTNSQRQRTESDYQAQYAASSQGPANDDDGYVAAVIAEEGFGVWAEGRNKRGEPVITGPFIPYAAQRRAMGTRP